MPKLQAVERLRSVGVYKSLFVKWLSSESGSTAGHDPAPTKPRQTPEPLPQALQPPSAPQPLSLTLDTLRQTLLSPAGKGGLEGSAEAVLLEAVVRAVHMLPPPLLLLLLGIPRRSKPESFPRRHLLHPGHAFEAITNPRPRPPAGASDFRVSLGFGDDELRQRKF